MELLVPATFTDLPRHRARLEAACRAAMEDPDVVGMALGGSFAEGSPDEYSDLDLKIVVEDEAFDRALGRREELAEACGHVVAAFTGGHVGEERLLITLYDDLLHVDFLVVGLSGLAEQNHGRPVHVLWERNGRLSKILPGEPSHDPASDLEWMEARIWTWVWYTHSKILRGELYEAIDALNVVRGWVLFRLTALRAGEPSRGARFAEERIGDRAEEFARTVAGPLDREALLEALRATVRLYLEMADPLLERHGIERASEARAAVLGALERGLGWSPGS
jgi:hypothetical protein